MRGGINKKRWKLFLFMLTFIFCRDSYGGSSARVLYVAQWAPGASDFNDGATASFESPGHGPFLTVQAAANVALPRDTIQVLVGNYLEDVIITRSGITEYPIVFNGNNGKDKPAVVRSITALGSQYINIQGFRVIGPFVLPPNWKDMPNTVVDDPGVGWIDPRIGQDNPELHQANRYKKIWQKYATYMAWNAASWVPHLGYPDGYYYSGPNAFSVGIAVKGASNITILNNIISGHQAGIGVLQNNGIPSSSITITGNSTSRCARGLWAWGEVLANAFDNLVVRSNAFDQSIDGGIVISSANHSTIEGNRITYSGTNHISLGTKNTTVRANIMSYGGYYTEAMFFPGSSAISLCGNGIGPGNIIERNAISYQYDPTGFDGNGIILDTGCGLIVPQTVMRNNVIYRTQGSGITNTRSPGQIMVNNTIVEPGFQIAKNASGEIVGNGFGIRSFFETSGNVIANNIVFSPSQAAIGVSLPPQHMDNDLFRLALGVPAAALISSFPWTLYSLEQLQTLRFELKGMKNDPLFLNMSALDFRLTPNSPAIGKGDPDYSPQDDFMGNWRSYPPNIGAY